MKSSSAAAPKPAPAISKENVADILCIGTQKAGTSWLNNVLLEHPQIFMPPVNELHFFDRVRKAAPIAA